MTRHHPVWKKEMEYDDDAISRMFASPIACIFPYSYNFYTTVELCKHIEIKLIKTNDSKVLEVTSNKPRWCCSGVALWLAGGNPCCWWDFSGMIFTRWARTFNVVLAVGDHRSWYDAYLVTSLNRRRSSRIVTTNYTGCPRRSVQLIFNDNFSADSPTKLVFFCAHQHTDWFTSIGWANSLTLVGADTRWLYLLVLEIVCSKVKLFISYRLQVVGFME